MIAAVFGPHEPTNRGQAAHDRAVVRCEYAMAAFSTGERRGRGKTDRRATEITRVIRSALEQTILLELMPGSQIDIFVQVRALAPLQGLPSALDLSFFPSR